MVQKCSECGESRREYRADRQVSCSPVQLELSRRAQLRRRLRGLIDASGLPIVVFGEWVLGRDPRTVQRWLAGEKIPHSAAIWIDRLELVELRGGSLVLELRWHEARPRWRFFQAQKRRTLFTSAK
jgi:hypothetical protein